MITFLLISKFSSNFIENNIRSSWQIATSGSSSQQATFSKLETHCFNIRSPLSTLLFVRHNKSKKQQLLTFDLHLEIYFISASIVKSTVIGQSIPHTDRQGHQMSMNRTADAKSSIKFRQSRVFRYNKFTFNYLLHFQMSIYQLVYHTWLAL